MLRIGHQQPPTQTINIGYSHPADNRMARCATFAGYVAGHTQTIATTFLSPPAPRAHLANNVSLQASQRKAPLAVRSGYRTVNLRPRSFMDMVPLRELTS